jgi:hypothetical protein
LKRKEIEEKKRQKDEKRQKKAESYSHTNKVEDEQYGSKSAYRPKKKEVDAPVEVKEKLPSENTHHHEDHHKKEKKEKKE